MFDSLVADGGGVAPVVPGGGCDGDGDGDWVGARADALAAHALTVSAGAGLAAVLGRIDVSGLSGSGRLDFLQACERLAAWTAALALSPLVDHVGRDDVVRVLGDDGAHYRQRGEVAELAVVLAQSENLVRDRVWVAAELTGRLAATGAALAEGCLSYWHARVLVEAVAGLDDDQAAAVQARVLAKATGRTLTGFRRVCRAAVVRVDADAVVRRHHRASTQRGVRWWPTDDGMANLGVDAPPPTCKPCTPRYGSWPDPTRPTTPAPWGPGCPTHCWPCA